MQTHAEALPLPVKRADDPRLREAVARSIQDRIDVSQADQREIGRDANPPYDPRGVIVVASAWLAIYVIAAIHHVMASGT